MTIDEAQYTKEEKEDGTIVFTPKGKKFRGFTKDRDKAQDGVVWLELLEEDGEVVVRADGEGSSRLVRFCKDGRLKIIGSVGHRLIPLDNRGRLETFSL